MNFKWNISTKEDYNEFDNWIITNNKFLENRNISEVINNYKTGCVNPCYCATARIKKEVCGFVLISHKVDENPIKDVLIELIVTNPKFKNNGFGTAMVFDVVKNCEQIFGISPEKIYAHVNVTNNSSKKIFLKNEFINKDEHKVIDSKFDFYKFEKYVADNKLSEDKLFKKNAKKVIKQLKK